MDLIGFHPSCIKYKNIPTMCDRILFALTNIKVEKEDFSVLHQWKFKTPFF